MLTRLSFKNWRSLRDVEINDLTPITVFIGENSSGKTNILDALRFLHYSHTQGNSGIVGALRYKWDGRAKVRTIGASDDEPTSIEFDFQNHENSLINNLIAMSFPKNKKVYVNYTSTLKLNNEIIRREEADLPARSMISTSAFWPKSSEGREILRKLAVDQYVYSYIRYRWQIFNELFQPQLILPPVENTPGDLYVVEEDGRNIVFMLDNLYHEHKKEFHRLQDDIKWLLQHLEDIIVRRTKRGFELKVKEIHQQNMFAPSMSAGTTRLIAMLTAIHTLRADPRRVQTFFGTEFPQSEQWIVNVNTMPGLVVIEEPDTALNPGILSNFVELLRNYTEGEHSHQFILTTHNPRFLDYFKPEEVRVVSRDENGYTKVERIPDYIEEIWLQDHTLGEAWMTRSLGGLPE